MAAATTFDGMAATISQQVEQMIAQAKKDSENRIKHELQAARTQMQHMDSIINQLSERVERTARRGHGGAEERQTVDHAFLNQQITQLEQKWASETKALKQDLHRTILAHNHNSDLMRVHRDALDNACSRLDTQVHPKAEHVSMQLSQLDRLLHASQAKQSALDVLTEHLAALEHQVRGLLPDGSAAQPPYAPIQPGLVPGMGMHPGMSGQASATGQVVLENKLADSDTGFNAKAPVFIPRSQPETATAKGDAGGGDSGAKEEPTPATAAEPAAADGGEVPATSSVDGGGAGAGSEENEGEDEDE